MMHELGDTVKKPPVIPANTPRPVVEIIEAILESRDMLAIFEGRRGMLYVDYRPGDVKLRLDKLGLERIKRTEAGAKLDRSGWKNGQKSRGQQGREPPRLLKHDLNPAACVVVV